MQMLTIRLVCDKLSVMPNGVDEHGVQVEVCLTQGQAMDLVETLLTYEADCGYALSYDPSED